MLQELLNAENGYFWILLGLALMSLEALGVPGFFLGTLGLAAVVTSLPAFFTPIPIIWLLLCFGVMAIVFFVYARPLVTRFFMSDVETLTNVDGMVGKLAVVSQEIGGRSTAGYVKLAGDEWRALPADGSSIAVGKEVEIQKLEGATVYVVEHSDALQTEEEEA
jgi:membrane protein implicated in regulation of membrane protease activity